MGFLAYLMKKLIIAVVLLVYIDAIFAGGYRPFHQKVLSLGKTENVTELSLPESMTMTVGETEAVPITMTTEDGRDIEPDQLAKICKQYMMAWATTNGDVAYVTRDGQIVTVGEGTVTLMASSYNTGGLAATMELSVVS